METPNKTQPQSEENTCIAGANDVIRTLKRENREQRTTINIAICALAASFIITIFCICFSPYMI